MNYVIISDSSSDVLEISNVNYQTVPLKIITSEKEFVDDKHLDLEEMVGYLREYNGRSGSACPNVQEWQDAFGDADAIFCVTITSNLSGSYNTADSALKEHLENYPERKGVVIDSLSTGPEMALIIEKLISLIGEGLEFEEISQRINEYKNTTHLLFGLESLHNLAANGRISGVSSKIAGILGIRVVGKASNEGTLEMLSKVRGGEKMISCIMEQLEVNGYSGGAVRIHHCANKAATVKLINKIKEKYPDADVKFRRTKGLCSFYAERGGVLIGYEGSKKVDADN